MSFKKIYNSKDYKGYKEPTNKERKRPTFTFKVDEERRDIVQSLANQKQLTKFINEAIALKIKHDENPKALLCELIPQDYGFSKHIVRQTGRAEKRAEMVMLKLKKKEASLSSSPKPPSPHPDTQTKKKGGQTWKSKTREVKLF